MAGRVTGRVAALALTAALAAGATGCETLIPVSCDRTLADNPPVAYTGGVVANGVYMSSPWDGEMLDFPGGARYDLVVHGLGAAPHGVELFLSFDEFGTRGGGAVAPAAGNQAEVVGVVPCASVCDAGDPAACTERLCQPGDWVVQVANDSCVEYWLLVTAS
jgi:hypothetical protein